MLKVKLVTEGAKAPTVANEGDLGYDLFASEDVVLREHFTSVVPTGIAVEDTEGHGFIIKDRSSMAAKGIFTHGGVIDAGYRGEIKVIMTSKTSIFCIKKGDKVAQMVPVKPQTKCVRVVENLGDTVRGANGFGSSGA